MCTTETKRKRPRTHLLLSCPLLMAWMCPNAIAGQALTLNPIQHQGLATLVQFTLNSSGSSRGNEHDTAACGGAEEEQLEQLACLVELAIVVDAAFTAVAGPRAKEVLWSSDEGLSKAEAAELLQAMKSEIRPKHSWPNGHSCSKVSLSERRDYSQRLTNAFLRACSRGHTASFSFESLPDRLLTGVLGRWANQGFSVMLLLALAGAWLVVDRVFVSHLFRDGEPIPCHCRLCSGDLQRLEKVGCGGFAVVWLVGSGAEQLVLKMIEVDLERDLATLQGALDEAKALIALRHPHVVAYHDVFIHRDSQSGRRGGQRSKDWVCILMENCEGGTLLDQVADGLPLPWNVLLPSVCQIAQAVAYIHARGLLHFDLKLENIFLANAHEHPVKHPAKPKMMSGSQQGLNGGSNESRGRANSNGLQVGIVKIGDFGLTRVMTMGKELPGPEENGRDWSESPPSSTHLRARHSDGEVPGAGPDVTDLDEGFVGQDEEMDAVGGTAPYQPPECFQDGDNSRLGPGVDVWALGCLVYEAVTCMSLPLVPPFLGQLALTDAWEETQSELLAVFAERLAAIVACAAAERGKEGILEREHLELSRAGLVQLLSDLLATDPSKRPSLEDVLTRPFLQGFRGHHIHFVPVHGASRSFRGMTRAKSTVTLPVPGLGSVSRRLSSPGVPTRHIKAKRGRESPDE
ncbi:unnamed protein product [Chrysoparadoxa australica]